MAPSRGDGYGRHATTTTTTTTMMTDDDDDDDDDEVESHAEPTSMYVYACVCRDHEN